jgi:hypothetical protein
MPIGGSGLISLDDLMVYAGGKSNRTLLTFEGVFIKV